MTSEEKLESAIETLSIIANTHASGFCDLATETLEEIVDCPNISEWLDERRKIRIRSLHVGQEDQPCCCNSGKIFKDCHAV